MNDLPEINYDRIPLSGASTIPLPRTVANLALTPPKKADEPVSVSNIPAPPAAPSTPVTPAPVSGEPAPEPRWVAEALGDLFTPTKKKAMIVATAGTLAAGAWLLNGWLSAPTPRTVSSDSKASFVSTKPITETKPSDIERRQQPSGPDRPLSSNSVLPDAPASRATVPAIDIPIPAVPTPATPFASHNSSTPIVPAIVPDRPSIPNLDLPVVPSTLPSPTLPTPSVPNVTVPSVAAPVIPVRFDDPVVPKIPVSDKNDTGPSAPVIPPAIPDLGKDKPTIPSVIPDMGKDKPTIPAVAPPSIPSVSPTETANPPIPKLEIPGKVAEPKIEPKKVDPIATTPMTPAPVVPDIAPAPAFKPIPTDEPKRPTLPAMDISPLPKNGADARPIVTTESPRTDFDVDLHQPKAGDTYATISKLHLGDAKYADALRAFNNNQDLGRGGAVQIPPLYVLRQRYGTPSGNPSPIRTASGERTPDWSPAAANSTATYTVPRSGMTLFDVAQDVYGDSKLWRKIFDINTKYSPDFPLPLGAKLTLPPDAPSKKNEP